MSVLRSSFLIAIVLLVTIPFSAQTRMSGTAVRALDGRTLAVESGGRTVTVEIQFIEVPGSEQALHQTVREHLAKLAVGRTVEMVLRGFSNGRSIGRVSVDGKDIAIQMLRDGAAWHLDPEKTGQDAADAGACAYHQNQARLEGRGVWGVAGLRSPSELQTERSKELKSAENQLAVKPAAFEKPMPAVEKETLRRNGPWSDTNPHLKDPGALVHGYNAASRTGFVGTTLIGVKEKEGQAADHKTAVDITYLYTQEEQGRRTGRFTVSVISHSDEWRFLKQNTLVVHVDDKKYVVGKPGRETARENGKLVERLTYEVDRSTIEKVVFGGEVYIKIGDYAFYPTAGIQLILFNMLQVAE
ncbi:MAG: thermonuclease family protein [Chloracidobacterium sp.]|nr:thermonuclease family protein [Chloracidobacterium sp.]